MAKVWTPVDKIDLKQYNITGLGTINVVGEVEKDKRFVVVPLPEGYEVCVASEVDAPAPVPPTCPFCNGGKLLELRVQIDQKVLTSCVCEQSIGDLARQVFIEGYKRAQADNVDAAPVPLDFPDSVREILQAALDEFTHDAQRQVSIFGDPHNIMPRIDEALAWLDSQPWDAAKDAHAPPDAP